MAKYLVTGGAGFIGSHIVEQLLKRKHRVRVLDNFSTGSLRNLKGFQKDVEIVRGSLTNLDRVKKAARGMDGIFHAGAIRAVARSVDNPTETHETNVTGTLNVLLAARDRGVRRVVCSSSSAIYGDSKKYPVRETDEVRPASPYGASKLMGEHYCSVFSELYGLESVNLRYFNVYGPRQNPESKYSAVIPIFIARLLKNKRPVIDWDGRQSRDFVYIDEVVQANLLAMRASKAKGQVFNVATREEHSVNEIFNELRNMLNKKTIQPMRVAKRSGDVRRTFADVSKAKRLMGYRVKTSFSGGLRKTVEWFLKTKEWERVKV